MVGVPPHLQLPEHGILGVDNSVVVGVEQPQRAEARCRLVRIEELREELPPARDLPVMVAVERQQAILGLHPGSPLDEPVTIQIEDDPVFRRRLQQHTVMIQVEDDRIAAKEAPKEIKTATTKEIETAAPKEGRWLIKNRWRLVENRRRLIDDRWRHVDDRWWLVEDRWWLVEDRRRLGDDRRRRGERGRRQEHPWRIRG